MAEIKKLGAYCGTQAIYFVETVGTKPVKLFRVPFPESDRPRDMSTSKYVPPGMQLSNDITNVFKQEKILHTKAHLSLPTKDTIFRTFTVPWMQPSEVRGVVEFEASKYIPFSLDELAFSFNSIPVQEGGIKRIRVIFVAIKKDAIEEYKGLLEQASVNVSLAEPAPLSIIRSLQILGQTPSDQTYAIIEKNKALGKIIIVDKLDPQFVREFQLKMSSQHDEEISEEDLVHRLINEIRISLDYFGRQNSQLKVTSVLYVTTLEDDPSTEMIEKDLELPTKHISTHSIFGSGDDSNMEYLSAFGVGAVDPQNYPAHYDLVQTKRSIQFEERISSLNLTKTIKPLLITLVLCLAVVFLAYFATKNTLNKPKKELQALQDELGIFEDAEISSLESERDKIKVLAENYQKIRSDTRLTAFLVEISRFTPEGVWLDKLRMTYTYPRIRTEKRRGSAPEESAIQIEMSGYVYSEETRDQFNLVNQLLRDVKQNDLFQNQFEKIDLTSVRTMQVLGFPVTAYTITCE